MARGKALKAKNPTAAAPESEAPTTSHAPAKAQPSRAALAISAGKENASAALAGVMKVFHRATKPAAAACDDVGVAAASATFESSAVPETPQASPSGAQSRLDSGAQWVRAAASSVRRASGVSASFEAVPVAPPAPAPGRAAAARRAAQHAAVQVGTNASRLAAQAKAAALAALSERRAYFESLDAESLLCESSAGGTPASVVHLADNPPPSPAPSISALLARAAPQQPTQPTQILEKLRAICSQKSGQTPARAAMRTHAWVRGIPEGEDAGPPEDAAASLEPAPQPLPAMRNSLGLSRRASLGFAAPGAGALNRRISSLGLDDAAGVSAMPQGRTSLTHVRRISLVEAPASSTAAMAMPSSRRSSVAAPGRASVAPGAGAGLAPFAPIAEAEADEAAEATEELEDAEEVPSCDDQGAVAQKALLGDGDIQEQMQRQESLSDAESDVESQPWFAEDDDVDALGELTQEEAAQALSPLAALLHTCGQRVDAVLPMAQALRPWLQGGAQARGTQGGVKKIGEGTFGEAFKCPGAGVVLKVVPFGGDVLINGDPQKEAESMRAEAALQFQLSRLRDGLTPGSADLRAQRNATAGFVETSAVLVTRGPYAPQLLSAWRAYEEDKGSQNQWPGDLPDGQLFAVFVLADGGFDLEGFQLRDAQEAKAVLLQVAATLAVAEDSCQFEHRDLHWGNVLVNRTPGIPPAKHTLRGVQCTADTEGLSVIVIDFTLSRMQPSGGGAVLCCDLEADPAIFEGPNGDTQFDTYRRMRKAVRRDWSVYAPRTNALWLHYLADCMLEKKSWAGSKADKQAMRAFRARCAKYASAQEAVLDELFVGMWNTGRG